MMSNQSSRMAKKKLTMSIIFNDIPKAFLVNIMNRINQWSSIALETVCPDIPGEAKTLLNIFLTPKHQRYTWTRFGTSETMMDILGSPKKKPWTVWFQRWTLHHSKCLPPSGEPILELECPGVRRSLQKTSELHRPGRARKRRTEVVERGRMTTTPRDGSWRRSWRPPNALLGRFRAWVARPSNRQGRPCSISPPSRPRRPPLWGQRQFCLAGLWIATSCHEVRSDCFLFHFSQYWYAESGKQLLRGKYFDYSALSIAVMSLTIPLYKENNTNTHTHIYAWRHLPGFGSILISQIVSF